MAQDKPVVPSKPIEPPKKMEFRLLGHNYVTPDLVAKVTGGAKYAEDFRADGMVFIKLMPSPRPHARVRSIDASAALAMPGVHGILTAKDLPAPPPPPGPPPAGAAAAARPAAAPRIESRRARRHAASASGDACRERCPRGSRARSRHDAASTCRGRAAADAGRRARCRTCCRAAPHRRRRRCRLNSR